VLPGGSASEGDEASRTVVCAGRIVAKDGVALKKLVRVFFQGSPGQTATALLKHETWTDQELETLSSEIERVRKERRRS